MEQDRGQALPLVAAMVVIVALAVLAVARLGTAAVERARAQTAADAAALAGAAEGRDAAVSVARANGGRLVRFRSAGDRVEVEVAVDDAVAVARAAVDGTFTGDEGSGP